MILTYFSLTTCFLGYCLFIQRNRRISFAFTPAIASSFITIVLFVGGICSALSFVADALYWMGLGLFAIELIIFISKGIQRRWNTAEMLSAFLWVVGGYILFLYLTKENYFLYHYDNFSHWGIIARLLLKTHRFPIAADANYISFRSYPVGTAAFIYFFARRFRLSQSNILLLGQAILLYNFYFSLFGCIRTKNSILRIAEMVACSIMMVFLVTFNIKLDHLLVDNVVSSIMLACILLAFVFYQHVEYYALELGIIAGAGITVKTSGLIMLFFLLMIAYHIYEEYFRHVTEYEDRTIRYLVLDQINPEPKPKVNLVPYYLLFGIPLGLLVLWKIHGFLTFSLHGITGGKHSGSISSLLSNMGVGDERYQKCDIIFPYIFSFKKNLALVPLAWIVMQPVLQVFSQSNIRKAYENNRELIAIVVISTAYYLVFEFSLLLMYLFSMPLPEMIAQNGRDYIRYNGTIVSVMAGVAFFLMIRECESVRTWNTIQSICIILIGGLAIGYSFSYKVYNMPTIENSRNKYPDFYLMERVMQTDSITSDDRVLLRCAKNYKVPHNAANYYLYPCQDYTIAYSKDSYREALEKEDYTIAIDLVNNGIRTQNGKQALEDFLEEYGK